jgi:Beta/Gamma crystallin/Exotoxin A binding
MYSVVVNMRNIFSIYYQQEINMIIRKIIIIPLFFIALPTLSNESEVCFYEHENYTGNYFCLDQGKIISSLSHEWNDKISSIKIPHGIEVSIYKDINYRGDHTKLNGDVNVKDLKKMGLHDNISSLIIGPASCFYSYSGVQEESICLSPGDKLDLYNYTIQARKNGTPSPPVMNDQVDSISVPDGVVVTIFENDNFNPEFYKITESIDYEDLEKISMNKRISSIKAETNTGLSCDLRCAIFTRQTISLHNAFYPYWSDSRFINRQLLLSFDNNEEMAYEIDISNGPKLIIKNKEVIFSDVDEIEHFILDIPALANKISIVIQFKEGFAQVKYITSNNTLLIDSSPLISFPWHLESGNPPSVAIINRNTTTPLILDKAVTTADSDQRWSKRDTSSTIICWATPLLNVYNYVVQGPCNQLDSVVKDIKQYFAGSNKGITLQIAGSAKQLPPIKNPTRLVIEDEQKFVLTHFNTNFNKRSLSLPATAKSCNTSVYPLFSPRQPRQTPPDCITWTLEILTDFTLLFGNNMQTWTTEYFGNIIDSIINNGHTGFATTDPEIENRLIDNVREHINQQEDTKNITHIKTAFDYAQLSYANYLMHHDEGATALPQDVEQLPLGVYELALESFNYQNVIPRIHEDGHWQQHPELNFEVEIFHFPLENDNPPSTTDQPQNNDLLRQTISHTIETWEREYLTMSTAHESSEEENFKYNKIRHAGNITSGIISRRLQIHRGGEIFVVVKLRGKIVSILLADRFLDQRNVELVASITNPLYVLMPDADQTIRGGGTAAVMFLARYLKEIEARALVSDVISHPSARVKQKLGFNFKEEL